MPTTYFVDPTNNYNARGDRALRGRRGPFKAPNGALYTHLQDANSSSFGLWKSTDSGVTWTQIHTFDRQGGGGWVSVGNVEQADMAQPSTASNLLFVTYPYGPTCADEFSDPVVGIVRLAVIDTTDDSVTTYDGPTMNMSAMATSNSVRATVTLVCPSPDGTQAHIAYTLQSTGEQTGIALWNGSGFTSTTLPDLDAHPVGLLSLGAGVTHLMMYQAGSTESLRSYVINGLVASDGQTLESGTMPGGRLLPGMGAAYFIGGGQYRICIPVCHTHPTATSNYTPAALVGVYASGAITWSASANLLPADGTDVGSYHLLHVGGITDVGTHMVAIVAAGSLYVYWTAGEIYAPLPGISVSPIKLQRSKFNAGSWSVATTLYGETDLQPTWTGYGDIWVNAISGGAHLLIHPNVTNSGAPDSFWMSPYYLPGAISGGPVARYRAL